MSENLTNATSICQALIARRQTETPDLFSTKPLTYYWKLSDLAILYPDIFNIENPVNANTINNMHMEIQSGAKQFKDITPRPIHVLTVNEQYNIRDSKTNTMQVKKGQNQYLTPIACEYVFRQLLSGGKEIEQAFFMYPNKPVQEIVDFAKCLKFEHLRHQVSTCSNALAGTINRAHGARRDSFQEVWASFWRGLYNINQFQRTTFQIKNQSSLNFMPENMLLCVRNALQEIVVNFKQRSDYSIQDLKDTAYIKGVKLRKDMIDSGPAPEQRFTDVNSDNLINRIQHAREKFQEQNYLISLQQR